MFCFSEVESDTESLLETSIVSPDKKLKPPSVQKSVKKRWNTLNTFVMRNEIPVQSQRWLVKGISQDRVSVVVTDQVFSIC